MSYISQQFLVCDCSTIANLKAWGSAVNAALAAMGWTQTSDTGQVNWSTIAALPGGAVYEIWQPNDALQTGSTSYYLKVFYYYNGNNNSPYIAMQLGFATNGAGTFVGNSTVVQSGGGYSSPSASILYECNFSGDVDRMSMMLWRQSTQLSGRQMFAVERTKNTDGTNSSDGAVLYSPSSGLSQVLVFSGSQVAPQKGIVTVADSASAGDMAFNNSVPIMPVFPVYGKVGNPLTGFCFIPQNDIAEGGVFTTTLYGATRTYLATKLNGGWNAMYPAVRYD